jgi:hypothetical protein
LSLSVETLTQQFLEDVGFADATRIAAYASDRELSLDDGPLCIYREVNQVPQMTLGGWCGLTLHSYQVIIFGHDPDEVSLATTDLKAFFREGSRPHPLFKPTGWVSGDSYIEGGEIRDGSTDETPDLTTDRPVVQKTLTIDLWFQEP